MDFSISFGDILFTLNVSEFAIAMMALVVVSWIRR